METCSKELDFSAKTNSSRPAFRQLLSHADHGVQQINPGKKNSQNFWKMSPVKTFSILKSTTSLSIVAILENTRKEAKAKTYVTKSHNKPELTHSCHVTHLTLYMARFVWVNWTLCYANKIHVIGHALSGENQANFFLLFFRCFKKLINVNHGLYDWMCSLKYFESKVK